MAFLIGVINGIIGMFVMSAFISVGKRPALYYLSSFALATILNLLTLSALGM